MCWQAKRHWDWDLDAAEHTARANARSGRPVAAGVAGGGGRWSGDAGGGGRWSGDAGAGPPPEAEPDPGLLIADRDRERVVDALKQATADGRLTIDEFGERVEETYRARTAADLRHVLRQLPPSVRAAAEPARPRPSVPAHGPESSPMKAGGRPSPRRRRSGIHPMLLTVLVVFAVLALTGGRIFVIWPVLWLVFVFRHRWGWHRP